MNKGKLIFWAIIIDYWVFLFFRIRGIFWKNIRWASTWFL